MSSPEYSSDMRIGPVKIVDGETRDVVGYGSRVLCDGTQTNEARLYALGAIAYKLLVWAYTIPAKRLLGRERCPYSCVRFILQTLAETRDLNRALTLASVKCAFKGQVTDVDGGLLVADDVLNAMVRNLDSGFVRENPARIVGDLPRCIDS